MTAPALTTIRMLWLSLAFALVAFVIVLAFISPWGDADAGWFPWAVLVLAGLVHLVAIPIVHRRMTRVSPNPTGTALVIAFRDSMFVGVGLSEAIALLGFVGVFQTSAAWVYVLALPFALLGLVRVGPFQRTFERCDELLREAGSPLRMTDAWHQAGSTGSPTPPHA